MFASWLKTFNRYSPRMIVNPDRYCDSPQKRSWWRKEHWHPVGAGEQASTEHLRSCDILLLHDTAPIPNSSFITRESLVDVPNVLQYQRIHDSKKAEINKLRASIKKTKTVSAILQKTKWSNEWRSDNNWRKTLDVSKKTTQKNTSNRRPARAIQASEEEIVQWTTTATITRRHQSSIPPTEKLEEPTPEQPVEEPTPRTRRRTHWRNEKMEQSNAGQSRTEWSTECSTEWSTDHSPFVKGE